MSEVQVNRMFTSPTCSCEQLEARAVGILLPPCHRPSFPTLLITIKKCRGSPAFEISFDVSSVDRSIQKKLTMIGIVF